MEKAIFIDKDGTLTHDIPYNVDPANVRFTDGAVDGLKKLKSRGYLLIVVTNQSGIAHGYFTEEALDTLNTHIKERLNRAGIQLDAIFFCPHHPQGKVARYAMACDCRKPGPGMIRLAADRFGIDLEHSWMIGDILNDVEAGNKAGCKTILINNGNETEWLLAENRRPTAIAGNLSEAAEIIMNADY
ncbi:MAG TPA: HAD family hydrolase [Chryseosolibacter sp.]